ncbi:MAG: thermonuclease family protein [Planctomycetota bacterium]
MRQLAILVALACVAAEPATVLQGKVIHVADGDTLTILVGTDQVKIRLEGIDSPEAKQAFGNRAKQRLSELTHGKEVTVTKTGEDRYKRTLGVVWVAGRDVNAELVREGMAWHYKQFSKDAELSKLETQAREAKRGLWADPAPVAPWDFRKAKREADAAKRAAKKLAA